MVKLMNLKKSDKIIAISAVVILILAAIGVILYTDTEPEMEITVEELYRYNVKVEENSNTLTLDNKDYSITDRKPYTGSFEVFSDNLKNIDINVEYNDNDRGLLRFLRERRKNTITVKVYDGFDNEVDSIMITGMGNENLSIYGSDYHDIDQITAKDINEAKEKLAENLTNTGTTQEYSIVVTVEYGELRILKKIFERIRKDSFSIKITANHYDYQLEKIENLNDDDDYEETNLQLGYSPLTYVSTNYIGFH
jgi:hypothetical protein